MKLSQLQEAKHAQDPVINFIKKVGTGTDDYTQFPRKDIPQVVDTITRVFGQPKHEPRRTQFGGDAWRRPFRTRVWYWEIDNPDSCLNIFITIPKRAKGEARVARLGVENYEYMDEPDEHGYVDEALNEAKYHVNHPILEKVYEMFDILYYDKPAQERATPTRNRHKHWLFDRDNTKEAVRALEHEFGTPTFHESNDSWETWEWRTEWHPDNIHRDDSDFFYVSINFPKIMAPGDSDKTQLMVEAED